MPTIMRDGNWTHFGDKGGRWHYTPPYEGPKNPIAPYKGAPPAQWQGSGDLRQYGDPRIGPRGSLKGVLPGPGPVAGGRYHYEYNWRSPQNNLGRPTPFKNPYNKLGGFGRLGWKLSPVGRALDIGFQLLDMWQTTDPGQQEGWPMEERGWDLLCDFKGPGRVINGIRWVAGYTPITCDLSTVHTASNATINQPTIPADATTVFFGQFNPSGTRINHLEKWTKFPVDPVPAPIPWQPYRAPVVQPQPHTLAPPKAVPDPYPRERTRTKPRTRPRAGVRTKPAPYEQPQPNGRPPHVHVPTKPGNKKWKFPDYGIPGEIYGWLTELKDGLKCFEKNLKGHRIPKGGGLDERIYSAAQYAWLNPDRLDHAGFLKCLVYNHFEDKAIGKANQLANRITQSPYWQRPVGVGAGSWAVRM